MPNKKTSPTLHTLQSSIDEIGITIKSLVKQINHRFDLVDKRFDEMDERFTGVNGRFRNVERRFDAQEKMFKEWKSEFTAVFFKINIGPNQSRGVAVEFT